MTRIEPDAGPPPGAPVEALSLADVETVVMALSCVAGAAVATDEPDVATRVMDTLHKFETLRRYGREHLGGAPDGADDGEDDGDGFEAESLQDRVDQWHRGEISDGTLAQEVGLMVDGVNAAFDFLRSETGGAIDAHASVRIDLPRRGPGRQTGPRRRADRERV